jgi:hypothetical protein
MIKSQISYIELTNLLQANVQKSHLQPQCNLQLVYEYSLLLLSVVLHVYSCGEQHRKFERVICIVYSQLYYEICSSTKPTKEK